MAFFELPPRPEPPEEPPQPAPVWIGPGDNVLGSAVELDLVLARTESVAVAVSELTSYPAGFEFTLTVRLRDPRHARFWHPLELYRDDMEETIPDDLLRFGVQFSDGTKATSLCPAYPGFDPASPSGPVLVPRGGSGGGSRWDQRYWLWPLPPPGPVALVCEWPARGIALTRMEVDAGPILAGAGRAEVLWEAPEEPGRSGGSWTAYPG
jgi:hypothetical protein